MEPEQELKEEYMWCSLIFFHRIHCSYWGYCYIRLSSFERRNLYEGVEVDGIPLGTMTRRGPGCYRTHNQPKLDKIKITLIHGDKIVGV